MFGQKRRLFKCPVCDTVVEVLEECGLELVCCGPAMAPLCEKTADETPNPHIPIVQWNDKRIRVIVDGGRHPMDDEHYISWIEVIDGNSSYRHFLTPGEPADATFDVTADEVVVRVYCSVHGLWKCMSARETKAAGRLSRRPLTYRAAV